MKFTVEVETDCRVPPAPTKAPSKARPALTWDIKVSVQEARLISEPPPEPKKISSSAAPAPRASEPPPIPRVMETVSELPPAGPPPATRSVQVMSANKKKSTITITQKKSVSIDSSAAQEAERKLSKLMNTRGRKVTRQGDWIVFTEKVGILTSQNGVQQTREQRVKINSEDFARLTTLGF